MKITCSTGALLAAVQGVMPAIASRSTTPILVNLKMVAEGDGLILMGTDTEVGIRYKLLGVDVSQAGAAVVSPQKLSAILRESSEETIVIEADQNTAKLKSGTGRYSLVASDPGTYPDPPDHEDSEDFHEVNAGILRSMIRRVSFAADKKEGTRWAVTGILWETEKDRIRLVATDTKRLAVIEGAATVHGKTTDPRGTVSHLIPLKTFQLLEKHLADDGETIKVVLHPNAAIFSTARWTIVTQLVQGRFPPYREIFPKKFGTTFQIEIDAFAKALRQAAITADQESKRAEFEFAGRAVTIQAQGKEVGNSEVKLELTDYSHDRISIAFDPSYLLEYFRAIGDEPKAVLCLTNSDKPAVFRLGDHYSYLVMPMGD